MLVALIHGDTVMKALVIAGILGAASLVATSSAEAGNHWKFGLHNNSAAQVTVFQTKEGSDWSKNWLPENVKPGEIYTMDFGSDAGDCVVKTHIEFTDNTTFDSDVDYCKVSNLYVRNTDVQWD